MANSKNHDIEILEADVLVIGGGLAGLWAAIRASELAGKVLIADKAKVSRSGSSVFCHSTLAPVPDNEFDAWFRELVVDRNEYLADQSFAELLLRENNERLAAMEHWGVQFIKQEGQFKTEAVRGQRAARSALFEGPQMMSAMRAEALRRGVELAERIMVCELLTSDGQHPTSGRIVGALGLHTRTNQPLIIRCNAVVIATGGMSPKLRCLYVDNITGDGQAMSWRAGAELGGMEFAGGPGFGIWNRSFSTGGQQQFLMHGAKIVNRLGERFMERYVTPDAGKTPEFSGHTEFGDVCRAMIIEIIEGRGPVYFDMRDWTEENIAKLRQVLPMTMKAFDGMGIDFSSQLVESTPTVISYGMSSASGIRIDTRCQSTVAGLYAAGVAADVGPGLTPQALCNVLGYRAGEQAAQWSQQLGGTTDVDWGQANSLLAEMLAPLGRTDGISPDQFFIQINLMITSPEISIFKQADRILATLAEFQRVAREDLPKIMAQDSHELVKANEAKNFLQLLHLIYTAALEREESRLGHFREEFPYRDNQNWLQWILLRRDSQEGITLRNEPAPLTPLRPDGPPRKPASVRYAFKGGHPS